MYKPRVSQSSALPGVGKEGFQSQCNKEQQLHSTDILCVVCREEHAISAEIIQEGFLEEVGARECFKEWGRKAVW